MLKSAQNRGFTLIELMVVIAIIAILSIIGFAIFRNAQTKARDSVRKQNLDQINRALQSYKAIHGKYPPADSGATDCPNPGAGAGVQGKINCYTYSTAGDNWIKDIAGDFPNGVLPKDPINNGNPIISNTNYSYVYGNLTENGQSYDLFAALESTSDSERCGVKGYIGVYGYLCNGDNNPPQFGATNPYNSITNGNNRYFKGLVSP